MKFKSMQVEIKAGAEDGLEEGQFVVYPSTFTRQPDSYGDVIAKGAFLDTIREWDDSGNTMPGLYGHRMDDPDFFVAGAMDMSEDDHGWRVKGEFDMDSPKGPQVYRLVKGRRLNKLSFAYDTLEEARIEENGQKVNELRKLRVHEFSFVPVGANQDTSVVAVKAAIDAFNSSAVGLALAKDNLDSLRTAQEALLAIIKAVGEDQDQASGEIEAKPGASDEEPSGVKSSVPVEEPKSSPSVDTWATQLQLLALSE